MNRKLLFLIFFLVFLGSNVVFAEDPIEISSFEDLKSHLEEGEIFAMEQDLKVLFLKEGYYVLKNDITIDEDDSFFDSYQDHIKYGLFAIKGETDFNGNGHSITMKKNGSHPLFVSVNTSGSKPLEIKNFTLVFNGDALGATFGKSIQGHKDSDGKSLLTISDINVRVMGDVKPIYTQEKPNYIDKNTNHHVTAVGFVFDIFRANVKDIRIDIKGDIGKVDGEPDKRTDFALSSGFVRGYDSSPDGVRKEVLKEIIKGNISNFDQGVLDPLREGGSVNNIKINIGGSIIANTWIDGVVVGLAETSSGLIENVDMTVEKDMKRVQFGGGKGKLSGAQEVLSIVGKNITALQHSNFHIKGKLIGEKNSVDVYIPYNVKPPIFISTGTCENYLGYMDYYYNNDVKVDGGIDVTDLNRSRVHFFGIYGNYWGGEVNLYHQVIARNKIEVGDIHIENTGNITFNGLYQRIRFPDDGKIAIVRDNEGVFGDITLISTGVDGEKNLIDGGLIGLNHGRANKHPKVAPIEGAKVHANNIRIISTAASGSQLNFSPGVTYNKYGVSDIDISTKDISFELKNPMYFFFGGLVSNHQSSLKDSKVMMGNLNVEFTDTPLPQDKSMYLGGIVGYSKGEVKNVNSFIKGIYGNINKSNINAAGGIGYGAKDTVSNSKVLINDSIRISNGGQCYVGGFRGYGYDFIDSNNSVQIGENLEVDNPATVYLGGYGGLVSGTKDGGFQISDSTSLIFGNIDGKTDDKISMNAGFLGRVNLYGNSEVTKVSNSGTYVGGKINKNIRYGGVIGFKNGGLFDNFTLLGHARVEEGQLKISDYVNPMNFSGGNVEGFSNSHFVLVDGKNRTNFKVTEEMMKENLGIENDENIEKFFEEKKIKSIQIAPRVFQDRYWGESSELENQSFPYESSYVIDNGGITLTKISPDKDILPVSGLEKIRIPDYTIRHLAIFGEDSSFSGTPIFDILGIQDKLIKFTIHYNGNGHTAGDPPEDESYFIENCENVKVADKGNLEREGHNFVGWNTEADGSGKMYHPGEEISLCEDIVLYATWKEKSEIPEDPSTPVNPNKPGDKPKPHRPSRPSNGGSYIGKVDDTKELHKHIVYIFGYPDGTVRPEGMITRAEAGAMIARLMELDLGDDSYPDFTDTKGEGWYNSVINAVVKAGYMRGYPDGSFRPNEQITRGEFTQLIMPIDKKNDGIAPFGDIINHWASKAIHQAYGNQRIDGYPDGLFKPDHWIKRGEAAKIINRLFDRMVKERGLKEIDPSSLKRFVDLEINQWYYYEMVEATNTHLYERWTPGEVEEKWVKVID